MQFSAFRRVLVRPVLFLLCATGGCSRQPPAGNDVDLYEANAAALTPGVQAVRVGEVGPSYPACASSGTVVNLSSAGETYLPLRAAPFAEAEEVARLGESARLFLCSRSLDQRWQGVIVPPADAPASDCGVTASLPSARPYSGPCKSGWVPASFIRPVAG